MEDIDFIWKGCVVLGGIYTFFIVEVILHGLGHDHSVSCNLRYIIILYIHCTCTSKLKGISILRLTLLNIMTTFCDV